jgi:hypothetical protein
MQTVTGRGRVPWKGFGDLVGQPLCCRVRGDADSTSTTPDQRITPILAALKFTTTSMEGPNMGWPSTKRAPPSSGRANAAPRSFLAPTASRWPPPAGSAAAATRSPA